MFSKGTKVKLKPFWHANSPEMSKWMKDHEHDVFTVKNSWSLLIQLEGVDFSISAILLDEVHIEEPKVKDIYENSLYPHALLDRDYLERRQANG